ncbi:MAG: ATP-binding cassette domain-containing protein [Candidatus Omnitrophica bacterium]|nr:ATP-binding cassette domain-containing protein [Candidatus Omnitrophota bacterium]MBU1128268.1 ATP-binding cassette domain-containing protein [Candidatus Omnitrophota bacterium]MBU1784024.1 ATP-binding cassette domain-containing protein [Candidatus Omnitrophota bacterium]MBU1851018.1 ATP-binding cassette domain-containing protein [Candidatus Omnitrophota bacterium]
MITVNNVSLQFGKRKLFSKVNCTFSQGNCYGLIGANGSGKSTFLKILSGDVETSSGEVSITPGKRVAVLNQDQFAFDEYTVLHTVIMGHRRLHDIMTEKDALYEKGDFSHDDGMRIAEIEGEFVELDGWNAEAGAAKLLSNVGISQELLDVEMRQLEGWQKVRVLLAQALFGNPDILLLDEPTNHLDVETCVWLEGFLCNFKNTAIVVSHDRHFLDKVCTHIADIDYGKIQLYAGNYTFWMQSSQLVLEQRNQANKKIMEKRKELEAFIARFSANASKARQATSRKKSLEKLKLEDVKPSSRKYPYINFEQERDAGNSILSIENLSKSRDGQVVFKDLNIRIEKGDKVAFVGQNDLVKTTLFQVLMGEIKPDAGKVAWGVSTKKAYYPKDNTGYFDANIDLIDWLMQYTENTEEAFVRGFLGRMLFSGDEAFKKVNVLSGGEKVRCMLARMMLVQANVLILDEPTNHLDLEAITALNEGLNRYKGTILFSSHDHQLLQTVANRIIEITPYGYIDRVNTTHDEYLSDKNIEERRHRLGQPGTRP